MVEMFTKPQAESAKKQYAMFKGSAHVSQAKIEKFLGADGHDVYNPSVPFDFCGVRYIAGRVERRECEESEVKFFKDCGNYWQAVKTSKLDLQDPFVTKIDGKLILGGVRVEHFPDHCIWTTDFYRVNSLTDFEFITSGPKLMKDIRLLQLPSGKIAVLTRPQGESMKKFNKVCAIGFTLIDNLTQLSANVIEQAPLLEGQFLDDEWGGCNQLFNLKNGLIGIIGHKAYRTKVNETQQLHYYGIAFCLNPQTRETSQTKVIIARDSFPYEAPKREDLTDVTFASGIERLPNNKARIFTGLSDSYVGSAIITDPFQEYEN